jgi:hypothetical protein
MPSDKRQPNIYQKLLGEVGQENPALGRLNIKAISGQGPYYSETTPSWEPRPWNPFSGVHTIQVRPQGQTLQRPDIKNMLGGEALHILGGINPNTQQPVDQGWLNLKQHFLNTLTPEQLTTDRMEYGNRPPEDQRTFADWMQQSRLDAYLRPAMFPMAQGVDPGWYSTYTPGQLQLLQLMQGYLKK